MAVKVFFLSFLQLIKIVWDQLESIHHCHLEVNEVLNLITVQM